jgi:metalloendopeptidase OMA1, mitochondrial
MQEPECDIASDHAPIPEDNALRQWFAELTLASARAQRPIDVIPNLKQMFIDAGFVDVHEKVYKIPINGWPRGRRLKKIGKLWHQVLSEGLPGFTYALFNRWLEIPTNQIEVSSTTPKVKTKTDILQVSLVHVRKAMADRHTRAYQRFYVVYGRKPDEMEI